MTNAYSKVLIKTKIQNDKIKNKKIKNKNKGSKLKQKFYKD